MPTQGPVLGFFRSFIAAADGVCSVVSLVCKYITELLITSQIEVEQLNKQTQSDIKDTHTHTHKSKEQNWHSFPRKNPMHECLPVFCRVQTDTSYACYIMRMTASGWFRFPVCYERRLVRYACLFLWLRDYALVCVFGSLLILFKSERVVSLA